MSLRVRRAEPADAPVLAAMARELNLHEGYSSDHLTPEAVLRDGFGAEPQFAALVAEIDGAVVGYALFHDAYEATYAARGVYLGDLFVRSEARRRGAGRTLLAAVARDARDRGRTFVWWSSLRRNAAAHGFYRALGAFDDPIVAHVLADDAFATLAGEGGGSR